MQLCYFYCSNLLCTEDRIYLSSQWNICLNIWVFRSDQIVLHNTCAFCIHDIYSIYEASIFSTSLQAKTVYTETENMQKELGISMFQLSFYMIKLEARVSLSSLMRYRRFNAIAYLAVIRFRSPGPDPNA